MNPAVAATARESTEGAAPESAEGTLPESAGADPLEIDRGQAQWRERCDAAHDRAQLSVLYTQRIRELSRAGRRPPEEPPS